VPPKLLVIDWNSSSLLASTVAPPKAAVVIGRMLSITFVDGQVER
jgi:hypothetical protein